MTPASSSSSAPSPQESADRDAEALGQRFLARLSSLRMAELATAVQAWRDVMAGPDASLWFAAEQALVRQIDQSHRQATQRRLLRALSDLFLSRLWFTSVQPGAEFRISEPSTQYVATTAMLALMASDTLTRAQLEVLYQPFRTLIPIESLGEVGPRRDVVARDRIVERAVERGADASLGSGTSGGMSGGTSGAADVAPGGAGDAPGRDDRRVTGREPSDRMPPDPETPARQD